MGPDPKPPNPVAVAQAVKQMRENMPALLELYELQANMQYHYFTRLRRAGFTSEQAMDIVKATKP